MSDFSRTPPTPSNTSSHVSDSKSDTARSRRKDCHRRGTPSRKRVAFTGLGVRLPLLPLFSSRAPEAARRASPQGPRRDARPEAWPSWQGSALLARRRREPLAGSSPAASAITDATSSKPAGRPAVTRRMLVRAQPSQLVLGAHRFRSRPGLLADRGCRPLKPATRVRIPLGASRGGGTPGSPTDPLLCACARVSHGWPPGRRSRPPAA